MNRALGFLGSSIGRKLVMALTGIVLFGFVMVHMAGNLQVYAGPGHLDEYGALLRKAPALLWGARLVLLTCALAHAWAALSLTLSNRAARPVGYRAKRNEATTLSSLTMRISGVVVLAFIVFHILHLTVGAVHPDFREGAVHHNFVTGFQVVWVSVFYVFAMLCLALHLWHGTWSMLQTLGLSHPKYNGLRQGIAWALTLLIVAGNISFPLAVLSGLVKDAPHVTAALPAAR